MADLEAWRAWPSTAVWPWTGGLLVGGALAIEPEGAIWAMYALGFAYCGDLLRTRKMTSPLIAGTLAAVTGALSVFLVVAFLSSGLADLSDWAHQLHVVSLVLVCLAPAERANARGLDKVRDAFLAVLVGALALWSFWSPSEVAPLTFGLGWLALAVCVPLRLHGAVRVTLVGLAIPAALAAGQFVAAGVWAMRVVEATLWLVYAIATWASWRSGPGQRPTSKPEPSATA